MDEDEIISEPSAEVVSDVPRDQPLHRRLLFWGLILILGVPAAIFGLPWLYHQGKMWRAHYLVREAKDLLEHHDPSMAGARLTAAYMLDPNDPEVIRAMADYDLFMRNPYAVRFYHLLASLPGATRADQRQAVRGYLSFGDLKAAGELIRVLLAKEPEAEDYALEAQMDWIAGERTQAVPVMKQALALDPENRANRLLLAQMLVLLPGAEQQEAVQHLRNLAQTKDQVGLQALETLARIPGLDVALERTILEQIRQHPLLDDDGRFAAWELEKRLGDRDAAAVMKDAVTFFQKTDLLRKAAAARWLYDQGQPYLALAVATMPEALGNQALFMDRMDALGYLKNWAEVKQELSDNKAPLPQTLIFLYRARAALELGDTAGSAANWESARTAAATDPGMLSHLGDYAVMMGLYDEAKKVYAQMAHSPEQAAAGYTALLHLETQHGTDAEILETLNQMMADLPQMPEPKNDWAYLNLLLNTNVDAARTMAQLLVAAHPEMLAYRSTLALAYLRSNDPARAEQLYKGVTIDWSKMSASWKMIYAVVLYANGKTTQAADFTRTINRSQLRPVEQALLDAYLTALPKSESTNQETPTNDIDYHP